jgi:WhiB family redox-sensing transcriptional regulator
MVMPFTRSFEWDDCGWRDGAACRSTDPELFFPAGTTGVAVEQIDAAKTVCRSCPVREQCLEFSMVTNQEAGIWGGTTEDERRKMRSSWVAARRQRMLVSR